MQRKNVRMLQIRSGLDLGKEPLGADDRGKLRPQNLYRHSAIVFDILREVDRRHSARANLTVDVVSSLQCFAEAADLVSHVPAGL